MTARGISLVAGCHSRRAAFALVFALGTLGGTLAVAPAVSAEDAMPVVRSQAPQTIAGEGDKTLLIDGPFGIEWQSQGKIGVSAAPDKPGQAQGGGPAIMSGPGADGVAKGGMKLKNQQRYRVSIMASGPWEVTVTW